MFVFAYSLLRKRIIGLGESGNITPDYANHIIDTRMKKKHIVFIDNLII